MAKLVLTDVRILLGEYDITGYSNQVEVQVERGMPDATVFGDGWSHARPGTKRWSASGGGYQDDDVSSIIQPDSALYGTIGATGRVFMVSPEGGDAGDMCYFGPAMTGQYGCFGAHGEMAPYSLALTGDEQFVRGTVLRDATITGAGSGTAYELGAVGATQHLYGALHVTTFTGLGSGTVKIQSAAAENFAGTVTDHITFTAATGVTYQFATPVDGEITDTWWRANVSAFTATNMAHTVVMGIQS